MGFIVYVEIKYKKEDYKRWEGIKNILLYSFYIVYEVIYYLKIDCDYLNLYIIINLELLLLKMI